MIGKLLGKKKEKFAMEMPAQGTEAVASEAAIAPVIVEATPEGTEAAVTPVAVAATPAPSYDDTDAIILAAVQAASREAATAATPIASFAENYLVNAGNNVSRRRPGGNMAAFKAMAQKVKF